MNLLQQLTNHTYKLTLFVITVCFMATSNVSAETKKEQETPLAYIISPANGEVVSSPFTVKFGLSNFGVAPAGVNQPNTGHHHLLINADMSKIDLTKSLPSNDMVKHFGAGQTETQLSLPKGKHTLQLILGNYLHVPHSPAILSEPVTISVK